MTSTDLHAQLAHYLQLQDESLAEGDTESAEELGAAIERVCALIDALA